MATPQERETLPVWVDDDPEFETDMEMDEDEIQFDDYVDGNGGVEAQSFEAAAARSSVPLWRLIEMSREDRSLRMELADFEDYDDVDGEFAGGLST